MRILLAEDDEEIQSFIVKGLREAGFQVEAFDDGAEAMIEANHGQYDILILDRMLPNMDGLSITKALRAIEYRGPILILSALGEVDHRVDGLRAGADDYLVKPFSFAELLARIDALLRRTTKLTESPTLQVDDLILNRHSREVQRDRQIIELLPKEFALLEYLMRHVNQVVTRTMLLESIWGINFDPQTNIVDVHISRLRTKLTQANQKPLVLTVRGAGYMLRA